MSGSGGYDIGASLASSSTSGASNNSPLYVTGGGGGNAPGAAASNTIKPATLALWFLLASTVLVGLWLFLGRKK